MVETTTPNNVAAPSPDAELHKQVVQSKETKKIVRLLTVVAYMMSVSMAALMLSAYYIFLWNPKEHRPGPLRLVDPCPECYVTTDQDRGRGEMSARSQTQSLTGSVRGSVKLAGEEAKDRMYEPKHKKKVVRVLTVIAYVFSVSLAAIMLSMYYIFIWQGAKPQHQHYYNHGSDCRPLGTLDDSRTQMQDLYHTGLGYNNSEMAETPRALPAKEDLPAPVPTTPLSRLVKSYLELRKPAENQTMEELGLS